MNEPHTPGAIDLRSVATAGSGTATPRGAGLATATDPPPARPAEPDAAECCGEGCIRCVYDRYDAALERYQIAFAAWQVRHPEA